MIPFFTARFTDAHTTPCITRQQTEGVAVSMHEGHLVVSVIQKDGSGMAVVLDDAGADQFAGNIADAIMAMPKPQPQPPTLRLVK